MFILQTPAFQRKFFRSPDAHMQSKLVAAAAAADEAIETTAEPAGASDDLRVTDLKIGVAHVYNLRGSPDKVNFCSDDQTNGAATSHTWEEDAADFGYNGIHRSKAHLQRACRSFTSLTGCSGQKYLPCHLL